MFIWDSEELSKCEFNPLDDTEEHSENVANNEDNCEVIENDLHYEILLELKKRESLRKDECSSDILNDNGIFHSWTEHFMLGKLC